MFLQQSVFTAVVAIYFTVLISSRYLWPYSVNNVQVQTLFCPGLFVT